MKINFSEIQRNLTEIANRQQYTFEILYELMAAYGRSAASITKLRNGNTNMAYDMSTEVLQKGTVYYRYVGKTKSLPAEVEKLEHDPLTARYNPRFLIATDLISFAAKDTKKGNTLEIKWVDIDRNVDFFYGWTGDEIVNEKTEAAADRRAADKMKELYFEVEKVNADRLDQKDSNFRHELNVFFTRLLFCFFAEDTQVFSNDHKRLFTTSIREFTQTNGSDLDTFLSTLFEALDAKDKSSYSSPFSNFPYVNGSLFDKTKGITIPKFDAQARKLILDCGALSWAEINPDIFGSMFQSIVDESLRETHGMHYTSVPNIMKTIEPLFLDELREEFDKNFDNDKKLQKLWDRISKIKVFDPACGSGNFLIIAYKELRKLEHAIIDRVFEEDYKKAALAGKLTSRIDLNNFYGIEIDDFACEVAVLSLYIAKHQMNIEFEKQFGKRIELIPLDDKANIVKANAARIDWQDVCPNKPRSASPRNIKQTKLIPDEYEQTELIEADGKEIWDEIYLISNPPYAGARKQDIDQKNDLDYVFASVTSNYRNMDYVAIWFYKAVEWLNESKKSAFSMVSTNSISQGQQIGLIWPLIQKNGLKIDYAYTSFKWKNSATNNAGITCVIIGMSYRNTNNRFIESDFIRKPAKSITPYLTEKISDVTISSRSNPISDLPQMEFGNMPLDGGSLLLSPDEKRMIVHQYPDADKFIRRIYGSREYINGIERWCLWINDEDYNAVRRIPLINDRIEAVSIFRLKSKDEGTRKKASRPYSFREQKTAKHTALIIPSVSSERRNYVPVGIIPKESIISNAAQAIYDTEEWVLGIISSLMHMVWLRAVGGKLETRIRYSKDIVYNNFPLKPLNSKQKNELATSARNILFAREIHSEKSLAEMYDPDKMPEDLREAHHQNDILVDRLYRLKPYENDEERLADLFALYEKMIAEEKKK